MSTINNDAIARDLGRLIAERDALRPALVGVGGGDHEHF